MLSLLVAVAAVVTGLSAPDTCYRAPVAAPVVDPFSAPACRWCPGNRGIEYATSPGSPVVAAAPGVVTFAGTVAGVRYVVIRHDDGRLATYGRLAAADVAVGARIVAGAPVGTTTERFYFGLREGGRYVDPAPFFARAWRRPVLVPVDGGPGRVPLATRCPVERARQGEGR